MDRAYQTKAVNDCRENLKRGILAQVLMLATGAGKTHIASMVAEAAVARGGVFLFIVDSLELVEQAASKFRSLGLGVGVIQGDHWQTNYAAPIQVATIQTLRSRWEYLNLEASVVMIDECHVIHKMHEEIIEECKAKGIPVIGLSATPFRKGLGKIFDKLVIGATTAELVKLGYLVPARCYAPFIPNLTNVRKAASGDWHEDALGEFMGDAKIVGDIVTNWKLLGQNRQTLVFACNVAHSKAIRDAFRRAGITAEHIDGYDKDIEKRTKIINDFKAGKIRVLVNVMILVKGFDTDVGCVVLARPTRSLMMHIQAIGRGLRTAPNKEDCIVIDHAGNCLRLGLPTDDLPMELCDGTKRLDRKDREKKDVELKKERPCPNCGAMVTSLLCGACGYLNEFKEDVKAKEGHLVELKGKKLRNRNDSKEIKERFYGELKFYANLKGFKSGWPANVYRSVYGVWPNAHKDARPVETTPATMKWIKHHAIKWAKRREN